MIIRGDVRGLPLKDECVQCVVTSPPYWGLRDYSVAGQIGLEQTPDEYVATMVAVMREVRRVLKPDGVVWLNLGDSYASGEIGRHDHKVGKRADNAVCNLKEMGQARQQAKLNTGLKPKDLCGMPWRVAFALQADGWWLRSDIIWAKPNPMPESVTDRPTRSHEYIFLLSKSASYYYDADAIREPLSPKTLTVHTTPYKGNGTESAGGKLNKWMQENGGRYHPISANRRDVWTINSEPTPEAHFATFPQALVQPCVLAGTSARGECVRCGANWVREIQVESHPNWNGGGYQKHDGTYYRPNIGGGVANDRRERRDLGWQPTCSCNAPMRPNLVLDCFLGSGTVGVVAERLGRRWVGVELSEEYIRIARKRTAQRGLFGYAIKRGNAQISPQEASQREQEGAAGEE